MKVSELDESRLALFRGRQLAIDTTLSEPSGVGVANNVGVALLAARRRKEATYPEPIGPRSRCRLEVKWEAGGLLKRAVF